MFTGSSMQLAIAQTQITVSFFSKSHRIGFDILLGMMYRSQELYLDGVIWLMSLSGEVENYDMCTNMYPVISL